MDELILRGNDTFDSAERWKIQTEVGKFMFDNALDIGLYNVSKVWPLGPKIDDWSDDLATWRPQADKRARTRTSSKVGEQ